MENIKLSIIVPVLNEEQVLEDFYKRIHTVLPTICKNYEILFVDDGSNDLSLDLLKRLRQTNPNIKILSLSRNFGHQIAISVGLKFSSGDIAVIIDADLQDPPELIPNFIKKWKEGYKIVYGIRKERKEWFFKRLAYKSFYRILKALSKTDIHLDSGDFCLLDRKIIDLLNSMPERARFLRGLRTWLGFRQTGIEYNRDKRYAGKAKYTLPKLFKLAFDGLLSFSEFPLTLASLAGVVIATGSIIYSLYIIFGRIFTGGTIYGWHTIVVAISFLGGLQLLMLGLLASYIKNIFDEIKQRPLFIIDQMIGFEDSKVNSMVNYYRSANLPSLQPESH